MTMRRNVSTITIAYRHVNILPRGRSCHLIVGTFNGEKCQTFRTKYVQANAVPWFKEITSRGNLVFTPVRHKSDNTLGTDPDHGKQLTKGICIFNVPSDVQLFYISADGTTVQSPSEPFSLNVIMLSDVDSQVQQSKDAPPAFLHVGNWVYPLLPGISPVKVTDYGAYIFPDVTAETEGSTVAVVLPDEILEKERGKFEAILHRYTVQKTEDTLGQTVSSAASLTARGITYAAALVSWFIKTTAATLGRVIKSGSWGLKSVLPKAKEPVKVDRRVQQGVIYAKQAATGAVGVTSYLVFQLAQGSTYLAQVMAPHLREQGGKVLPKALQTPATTATFHGATQITSSTLKGVGSVYTSLDEASQSLVKNLSDETVEIVQHTYGEEVGSFTRDTVHTARSAAEVVLTTKKLAMRKLVEATAKATGKKLIHEQAAYSHESDAGGKGDDKSDKSVEGSSKTTTRPSHIPPSKSAQPDTASQYIRDSLKTARPLGRREGGG